MAIDAVKKDLVLIGRTAYMKGLTAGWGGNLSVRIDHDRILITPHKKSLGLLTADDILAVNLEGELIECSGRPSTETAMHLTLYKNIDIGAVLHLHPPCLNSLIARGMSLELDTFESRLTLGGTPPVLEQTTPVVTEMSPLLEAFKTANLVCLKNHGTVAVGDDLAEALALTDVAEEAARMTINGLILAGTERTSSGSMDGQVSAEKLPVFSDVHLQRLQGLVNNDGEARRLGEETDLTLRYAIKQAEDGKVYNLHFVKGRIERITNDEDADFLNVGPKEIWIHIFNGRLDPFAATSQKKLHLVKGHIGDLSKWYAPFYRIFALWRDAPVIELEDE